MVLKPGLYNNNNSNTFNTYISSWTGNQTSSAHIHATMFSHGEHPSSEPNRAVILSSEVNTHQPRRSPTARLYSHPGKHPPTAHLHSRTMWLPQGFGSLPNGKPPTRRLRLPCSFGPYNVSFPARAGIPFLVGGSNPLFVLISRCASPAETGSQLRQYPSRTSRTASCASDTQHILRNYTIDTFLSNNISYNTIAGQLGCFIGRIHNNFMLHIKHVCSLPEYTSDCLVPPVTAGDRHQSGGSHPQRSREVAMTTSDHCMWPIRTIHQRP